MLIAKEGVFQASSETGQTHPIQVLEVFLDKKRSALQRNRACSSHMPWLLNDH